MLPFSSEEVYNIELSKTVVKLSEIHCTGRYFSMDYKEVYEQWIANPYFEEATKEELKSIAEDETEIKERF